MRGDLWDRPPSSCTHQRDGGERRAEFVGGGGGEAVELGEVLGAREHAVRWR